MTHKLLITAAIVAIAFAPSIGTGTAQAAVLVEVLAAAVFTGGMVAAFTAGMVASIRVIMVMAIPRTATTATDQV